MDQYLLLEKIGEGSYGVVFKAKHRITGNFVAIKKIRSENENHGLPSTAIREISILKELVHPNIVKLQDVLIEENQLSLVFEYLAMDLKDYLDLHLYNNMPEKQVKSFLYQILQAILFCHKRRILHRDLKPQNLLLYDHNVIKLADFGLARAIICVPGRTYSDTIVTLWYKAPELLLGTKIYSCPVDMWSIGCIFAEMATNTPLFRGDSEIDQLFTIFKVLSTPNERIWPGVSKLPYYSSTFPIHTRITLSSQVQNINSEGIDLLTKMLLYDPLQRISAKDAVKHPYFIDLDKATLPNYED